MPYMILCLCDYMCASNGENILLACIFIWMRITLIYPWPGVSGGDNSDVSTSLGLIQMCSDLQIFPFILYSLLYKYWRTLDRITRNTCACRKMLSNLYKKCYITGWFCVEIYDDSKDWNNEFFLDTCINREQRKPDI